MAALTSSFAFNAIQLSVMSQKFVTYSAVIPGKPPDHSPGVARPGIQHPLFVSPLAKGESSGG